VGNTALVGIGVAEGSKVAVGKELVGSEFWVGFDTWAARVRATLVETNPCRSTVGSGGVAWQAVKIIAITKAIPIKTDNFLVIFLPSFPKKGMCYYT